MRSQDLPDGHGAPPVRHIAYWLSEHEVAQTVSVIGWSLSPRPTQHRFPAGQSPSSVHAAAVAAARVRLGRVAGFAEAIRVDEQRAACSGDADDRDESRPPHSVSIADCPLERRAVRSSTFAVREVDLVPRDMPRARSVVVVLATSIALSAGCASTPACPATPVASVASVATVASPPMTAASAVDGAPAPMVEDMSKASATLDRFHAAAAAADEAAYFALFAEGGVFLGTDGKERWTVPEFRAYAHPRFASGKAWSFRAARRNVSVRGDMAFFDEELETQNLGPARGTGVLVRDKQNEWRVAQYNLSIPIPNERFAEVRRVIDGATATAPASTPAKSTDPPVCVAARAARKRSSPAAAALDAQCRAAGGTP